MALLKFAQLRGQPVAAKSFGRGNTDQTGKRFIHAAYLLLCANEIGRHSLDPRANPLSGRSQKIPMGGSLEQARLKPFLKLGNLPANGGL